MFGPFPGFLFVGSLFHVGGQDFPLAFQRRIYGLGIEFLVENIFLRIWKTLLPFTCAFSCFQGKSIPILSLFCRLSFFFSERFRSLLYPYSEIS